MVSADALRDVAEIGVEEDLRQLVPEAAQRLQMIAQKIETLLPLGERDQVRPLREIPRHGAEPERLARLEYDGEAIAVGDRYSCRERTHGRDSINARPAAPSRARARGYTSPSSTRRT